MIGTVLGELRILNVGEGDLTIKFDDTNAQEKKSAAEIIKDLLRKGYAIMIQVGSNEKGPIYQRATDFYPDTCEYIVMGDVPAIGSSVEAGEHPSKEKPGRSIRSRVPASTRAVAVARSAGGYDPILPHKINRYIKLREVASRL